MRTTGIEAALAPGSWMMERHAVRLCDGRMHSSKKEHIEASARAHRAAPDPPRTAPSPRYRSGAPGGETRYARALRLLWLMPRLYLPFSVLKGEDFIVNDGMHG